MNKASKRPNIAKDEETNAKERARETDREREHAMTKLNKVDQMCIRTMNSRTMQQMQHSRGLFPHAVWLG